MDELIDSKSDQRFGITLLIRLTEPIQRKVQSLLTELKAFEPDQYYYPNSDLHVTTLSIVSCYQGFKLPAISVDDYIDIVSQELENTKKFTIEFKGIILSKTGVLVKGFPDSTLNQIRERLRQRLKYSELEHSIDSRYAIRTAHCTVMRFRKRLRDKNQLIAKTTERKNFNFGTLEAGSMELVYNDWYQRKFRTKILKVINLK